MVACSEMCYQEVCFCVMLAFDKINSLLRFGDSVWTFPSLNLTNEIK